MSTRAEIGLAVARLVRARSSAERAAAAETARAAIAVYAEAPPLPEPDNAAAVAATEQALLERLDERLAELDDAQLEDFNLLLPWAAMTADARGRVIGTAWSDKKRAAVHSLVDRRQAAFDRRFPLRGRHVFEAGCFEGIHTLGCLALGARVTAVDGRMDNVLKTLARLWIYGQSADVRLWNFERPAPGSLPPDWDVLHHVGVLYHLSNPVEHLNALLPRTTGGVLLDTHVARDEAAATGSYEVDGRAYRYQRYEEKDVEVNPFAGLLDHAKWLRVEDLQDLLRQRGFREVETVENRDERNGRRVMIWAFR